MNEQVMEALGKLKEMWATGQITGEQLPQEAVASRMAMAPEEFVGVVKQSEELQKLFAQMMGTPPAMAGTYEAQSNLPMDAPPPQPAPPIPGQQPQKPNPFLGGAWGDVNKGL